MDKYPSMNIHDDSSIFEKSESPQSVKLQHMLRTGGAQSRAPHTSAALTKARKDRRNESKHGRQQGIDTTLDKITDFNSSSINKFNPDYSECEQQFISTLESFEGEVDKLQEMQEIAIDMVQKFNDKVLTSETSLDKDLFDLRKWEPPTERLRSMQKRVSELKTVMSDSKQKLIELDDEVRNYEEENARNREKKKSPVFIAAVTILIIAVLYYIFKR